MQDYKSRCTRTVHVILPWAVRFFLLLIIVSPVGATLTNISVGGSCSATIGADHCDWAFDQVIIPSEAWSLPGLLPGYLQYNLPTSAVANVYAFWPNSYAYGYPAIPITYPKIWSVWGCKVSDCSSYDELDSQVDVTTGWETDTERQFPLLNTTSYPAYRFNFIESARTPYFAITEVRLYNNDEVAPPSTAPIVGVYGTTVTIVGISTDVISALTPGIFKDFTGGDLSFWFGVLLGCATIWGFKAGSL